MEKLFEITSSNDSNLNKLSEILNGKTFQIKRDNSLETYIGTFSHISDYYGPIIEFNNFVILKNDGKVSLYKTAQICPLFRGNGDFVSKSLIFQNDDTIEIECVVEPKRSRVSRRYYFIPSPMGEGIILSEV